MHSEAGRSRIDAVLGSPRRWWSPPTKRVLALGLSATVLPGLVFWGACLYQRGQVERYVVECRAAEVEPLEVRTVSSDASVTFELVNPILPPRRGYGSRVWEVDTAYLVAAFAVRPQSREIRIEYESESPFNDFSHDVTVDADGTDPTGTTRYFFPVYQTLFTSIAGTDNPFQNFDGRWGRSAFTGITVPREHADEFLGLYRVADVSPFTLLMNLSISDGNEGFRYRQRARFQTEEPAP